MGSEWGESQGAEPPSSLSLPPQFPGGDISMAEEEEEWEKEEEEGESIVMLPSWGFSSGLWHSIPTPPQTCHFL